MPRHLTRGVLTGALLIPAVTSAASDADIAELRAELEAMRSQYETRIRDLEARLSEAERAAQAAERAAGTEAVSRPMTAPAAPRTAAPAQTTRPPSQAGGGAFGSISSGSAFNPQISVVLDGNYYHDDSKDGDGAELVSEAFQAGMGDAHAHADDGHDDGGHAHNFAENGFNFREAELSFTATVDPYFDAEAYISIDGDGNVELEEAFFQTRSLPWGLRVKGGKFLSDFGYINKQHPHQWDFVDQNLPYLNLLGVHGLQDTGLQLTWLPDLPFYTLIGAEALQGNQEIFGATVSDEEQQELNLGDTKDGPRLYTAFAKFAPDLGQNHALQFGLSYAYADQQQAVQTHSEHHSEDEHGHEDDGHEEDVHRLAVSDEQDDGHDHGDGVTEGLYETGLAGDADLWGIDLVYKYDAPGAYGQGDIKFQAEYLRSTKHMTVRASADADEVGSRRKFTTDGLYAQATYGFLPRWKAGIRYDVLGLTNKVSGGLSESFGSSDRWTADVTWNLSEFSALRAQYAYNDILVSVDERERFGAFYLQFLVSLGSHGAHEF